MTTPTDRQHTDARATARVARTIHGDVYNRQLGIVRATLAVALAIIQTLAAPMQGINLRVTTLSRSLPPDDTAGVVL